jgi:hypothetical protein
VDLAVAGNPAQAFWRRPVSNLRFTDGVEIETSGEYRTVRLRDGWYVVGHGTLAPCADEEQALRLRNELVAASSVAREDVADTAETTPLKFPEVHVQLTGEDGNVFSIIGRVRQALRCAGATEDDLKAFTDEVMAAGAYDNVLQTVMRWVDVS